MRLVIVAAWIACASCGTRPPPDAQPVPVNADPVDDPPPEPVEPVEPEPASTPASLYEACFDRVEQPQEEGECASDADCRAAGCGSEVCTTVAAAADLVSTCEVRRCFSVLDACGCDAGSCAWSLKDAIPDMRPVRIDKGD